MGQNGGLGLKFKGRVPCSNPQNKAGQSTSSATCQWVEIHRKLTEILTGGLLSQRLTMLEAARDNIYFTQRPRNLIWSLLIFQGNCQKEPVL